MELRRVLAAVAHWRAVTALILLGCLAAAGAYLAVAPRKYQATTTVFFSLNGSVSISELAQGTTYTQEVVKSYSQAATLPVVLDPVTQNLGLPESSRDLAKLVTVETQPDSVIATITVTYRSPETAARIADSIADQLAVIVPTLTPAGTKVSAPIRVTTLAQAEVPAGPSSPHVPVVVGAAVVGGLLLAVAAAILLDLMTSPLLTQDVLTGAGPLLARIPLDRRTRSLLATSGDRQSLRAKSFRTLRANMWNTEGGAGRGTVVVMSYGPGDGRTSVACNLAVAVMQAFRNVLIIDADVRKPSVASVFGLPDTHGLAEVLVGDVTLEGAVQQWEGPGWWAEQGWRTPPLHVLTAGKRIAEVGEILSWPAMTKLITSVGDKYDLVVVDVPPLSATADAALVAAHADSALLVVDARRTREREFSETVQAIHLAGGEVLGVVLNRAKAPGTSWFSRRPRPRITPRRFRAGGNSASGTPASGTAATAGPAQDAPLKSAPLNGAPLNGAPLNGAPLNGAPLNGGAVNGAVLNGSPAQEGPVKDVPVQDGPVQDGPVQDVPVQDVPVQDVPVKEVPVQDGPAKDASVQDDGAMEDPAADTRPVAEGQAEESAASEAESAS
jgi:polysaccharide biosynthesis transport protein